MTPPPPTNDKSSDTGSSPIRNILWYSTAPEHKPQRQGTGNSSNDPLQQGML